MKEEETVTLPKAAPPALPPPAPLVALVGRPNVGKSTLFNRLTRSRKALVAAVPGVTRDRREDWARCEGYRFRVMDTGGVAYSDAVQFSGEIAAQVEQAVALADVVWLVLDAAEGLNPFDAELYRTLQRRGKRVIAVPNKADSPGRRGASAEFFALGTDAVYPVSALHGTGVAEALEATAALVPSMRAGDRPGTGAGLPPAEAVRLAFVGRPNVGKSSLVNRILGEQRQIVSTIAGTTREAVEIPFRIFDADYVLVDTAGIRRRARTKEHLEKLSVVNALAAMDRADVIVLVVDAEDGAAEQDARIAGYILERGRGLVVALNKWDRVTAGAKPPKDVEADIAHTLRFTEFAPHVRISAATGFGLERLFKEVATVAREYGREVQTADLNRVAQLATRLTPPPGRGGSASRVFYGTQTRTHPPVFRFFTNHPEQIPDSYSRFFENQLRYHFGFKGIPLRIEWRGREGDSADPKPRKLHPRPLPKGQPRSKRRPAPGSKAGAGARGRKGGAKGGTKGTGPFARKTARNDARQGAGKAARGARRPP